MILAREGTDDGCPVRSARGRRSDSAMTFSTTD